jgi:hypothetical protein
MKRKKNQKKLRTGMIQRKKAKPTTLRGAEGKNGHPSRRILVGFYSAILRLFKA